MRLPPMAVAWILGAAVVAGASGCSGPPAGASSSEAPAGTVAGSPGPYTSSPAASASSSPVISTPSSLPSVAGAPQSTCGTGDPQTVVEAAAGSLSAPAGLEDATWDVAATDSSGFDPCADLSWAVASLSGSTVSSPTAILLFHSGSYLGTATAADYGFVPRIERTAPGAILVTYVFPVGSDTNADPSGRAVATYTWNPTTQQVDMAGETPPLG